MTTWWNLAYTLERAISTSIASFTKDLWKEDAITIEVVKKIRTALDGVRIDDEPDEVRILAQVFKADGATEEKYGDLAILVKITYRDGDIVDGVAFYEAKKRDWDKHTLPAFKKTQLRQMHQALWNGRMLVFDRDRVVSRLTETVYAPWWRRELGYRRDSHLAPVTRALAIPLGPVLVTGRSDTSLYKFGTPLACQVVLRNLQGLDLDHEGETLQAARGYSKRMDVLPSTVLAISVHEGPGEPTLPEVNKDVLQRAD